jgi:hypothetical protein
MLSTLVEIAAPLVALYNDILDAIIKSLDVRKALGILKSAGGQLPELPVDMAERQMRTIIERLFAAHCTVIDDSRRNELQNELVTKAMKIMPTIQSGTRLSLAATNKQNTITNVVGDEKIALTITQLSEATVTLEIKLEALAAEPALRIEHENQSPSV